MNRTAIYLAIAVGVALVIGGYFYPNIAPTVIQEITTQAGSPAGSQFSTGKIVTQTVTTATGTLLAVLNGDASDRTLGSSIISIQGTAATTTNFRITCATSTVATGFTPANPDYILRYDLNWADATTTGPGLYVASSSPGLTGTSTPTAATPGLPRANPGAANWASGTYLVCALTSTNTVASNSNLFPTGATGIVGFNYWGN